MEQKLFLENNNFITYKLIENNSNKDFDILYLHGFCGDMDGSKGTMVEKIAQINKINLIKLNYLGHGTSSGKLTDFTLTDWLNNIKTIINKFSKKKLLLIGSSMGAWLSYLVALEYKSKIVGIIAFSGAVDFLTEVIEPQIKPEDKNKDTVFEIINSDGSKSGNFITKKLLQDSKQYNLFTKEEKIEITCPIKMLHGMKDTLIPYSISLKFAEKLKSHDIEILIVKNADHRFSLENNLEILEKNISEFIQNKIS